SSSLNNIAFGLELQTHDYRLQTFFWRIKMNTSRFMSLCLCLLTLSSQTIAQSQQARPTSRTAARTAVDPNEEARRQVAISLLTQLADEARSYQDITLRARVQARAADSLWTSDEGRARALFRRAWDAADAVDR